MTETLARKCARRPGVTVAVWVVMAVLAGALIAQLLDDALTTDTRALTSGIESEVAASLREELYQRPEPVLEVVTIQSDSLTVDDDAFRQKVESVYNDITSLGDDVIESALNYYEVRALGPIPLASEDGMSTFIAITMTGDLETAESNIHHVFDIVHEADHDDGFRTLLVGASSISFENNELIERDLRRGEGIGVPIALLVLLVLFGTVVAALMPLVLAVVAIIVALALVAAIGQVSQLVFLVQIMITMIGLAVGIDYALFVISRFREELDRGLSVVDAAARAGGTAGRTVLFSGATVVISLLGMLIVPIVLFRSLGVGAIVVVIVAVLATLTLLPATLALLGHRINRLKIPLPRARSRPTAGRETGGIWQTTTRVVTKHPVISVVVVAVPLLVASSFYLQINTGILGVDTFPEDAHTREAFFAVAENAPFGFGPLTPIEVMIESKIEGFDLETSNAIHDAIVGLGATVEESGKLALEPLGPQLNPEAGIWRLALTFPGEPRSPEAVAAVNDLRENLIPAAFAGLPVEVHVGGVSANVADTEDILARYTPIVFAIILSLSFVILMVVFRSIVVPAKAVIMNLLSVGSAYGLLVLVFQGVEVFGLEISAFAEWLPFFREAPVIDVWIPLFLFSILFGLSMDYHVFLLSRVKEHFDRTGDNNQAVEYGLRSTSKLITGAALIMVVVFTGFASGDVLVNQLVGFGLAVAIFIDATLVRSILVPASMELLGKRNWYLPAFLRWLPHVEVEAPDDAEAA